MAGTWVGILAPAGARRDVVARLGRETSAIVQHTDVRERFIQLGIEPVGNAPEEFSQFLRDEVLKWSKVIKAANVKIDR